MKISRRRKHNKRSKYTRHTKHGGGKHYKNKRTYRKHPRKLKHKIRLQRGGVITETQKKNYTLRLDSEFPVDATYLFDTSYVTLTTEIKLSLYYQDLDYVYDRPERKPELLLRDIKNPEIRKDAKEFTCNIELVSVRVTNYDDDVPSKHTYKFKLSFYTGSKYRMENYSITYLELSLVFGVAWKQQLTRELAKEDPKTQVLPAIPDLPDLPAIPDPKTQVLPDLPAIPDPKTQGIVLDNEFMIELGLSGLPGLDTEHGITTGILTQIINNKPIKNEYCFFPFKAVRDSWDPVSGREVGVSINNRAAFQTIIDIMTKLIKSAEERINGI